MTVTAKEVKSVDGFVLDGTPQSIKIDQSQSPQRMTFWNERQGALIINKLSSLDRKTPLEGVTFKITTASSSPTKTEKSAPTVCTIPTKTGRSFSRASPAHWW